jgi:hypothetical protein
MTALTASVTIGDRFAAGSRRFPLSGGAGADPPDRRRAPGRPVAVGVMEVAAARGLRVPEDLGAADPAG